jgi:probable HAF family extracellular repeat protein
MAWGGNAALGEHGPGLGVGAFGGFLILFGSYIDSHSHLASGVWFGFPGKPGLVFPCPTPGLFPSPNQVFAQATSAQSSLEATSDVTLNPSQFAYVGAQGPETNITATPFPNLLATGFLAPDDNSPFHAFRATSSGDYLDLGTLGGDASFGTGVSSVGSVVGFSWLPDGNTHAFLWTETGGMVDLGSPNGPDGFSRAFGINADGSVIVGDWSDFPGQYTSPFIWTAAGGMQDLGGRGTAYAVTPDGSVVVGQANSATAFRWTRAGGLEDLGTLPGYTNSMATGVSADGQVVIGYAANFSFADVYGDSGGITSSFDTTCRAFIWTAATGMQDLTQVFADAGVDMTGITLVGATGISPDGQSVCGMARTPQNDPNNPYDSSGFVADLSHLRKWRPLTCSEVTIRGTKSTKRTPRLLVLLCPLA